VTSTADTYSAPWPSVSLVWPKPRTWRYLRDYSVEWAAEGFPRQRLITPAAFECDGASEPAVVDWYLGRELILRESGFHDLLYAYRGDLPPELHLYDDGGVWRPTHYTWSRRDADRLFARLLAMNEWIREDQRRTAYRMVRLFGWRAWQRERPRPTVLSATA
jgi:hypothetical protein